MEEDWSDPEQGEVPKWIEPDLSIRRQGVAIANEQA